MNSNSKSIKQSYQIISSTTPKGGTIQTTFNMTSRKLISLDTSESQISNTQIQSNLQQSKLNQKENTSDNLMTSSLSQKGNHYQMKRQSLQQSSITTTTKQSRNQGSQLFKKTRMSMCQNTQEEVLKQSLFGNPGIVQGHQGSRNSGNGIVKYLSNPTTTSNNPIRKSTPYNIVQDSQNHHTNFKRTQGVRNMQTSSNNSNKMTAQSVNQSIHSQSQISHSTFQGEKQSKMLFNQRKTSQQSEKISVLSKKSAPNKNNEENMNFLSNQLKQIEQNVQVCKAQTTLFNTNQQTNQILSNKRYSLNCHQSTNNKNQPPFTVKNIVLSQIPSSYKDEKYQQGIELVQDKKQHPHTTKNQGDVQTKFFEKKEQREEQPIPKIPHQMIGNILMTPSHVNHQRFMAPGNRVITQQSDRIEYLTNKTNQTRMIEQEKKPTFQYYCETGGSVDHRASPAQSQKSIIVQNSSSVLHQQVRPATNTGMINNWNTGGLIASRPSFDRSALHVLSQSQRKYVSHKNLDDTHPHEPKRLTPSDPSDDIFDDYEDDTQQENDSDCQYLSSAIDTLATASLVEGHMPVKLPPSQITTVTQNNLRQIVIPIMHQMNQEINSVKSTERYDRPFNRPQQAVNYNGSQEKNNVQPNLIPLCKLFEVKRTQKINNESVKKTQTKSNIIEEHNKEQFIDFGKHLQSRSQSPVLQNVNKEYFQSKRKSLDPHKKYQIIGKEEVFSSTLKKLTQTIENLCINGQVNELRAILQKDRKQVMKVIQQNKRFLLYKAIESMQLEVIKFLLKEIQLVNNENLNLLHIACRQKASLDAPNKDLDIIKIILKYDKKADLNDQDTYGNTPVHLAAQNMKLSVLQYFLSESFYPKILIRNSEGKFAMHYCLQRKDYAKVFLDYIDKLKLNAHKSKALQRELKLIQTDLLNDKDIIKMIQNSFNDKPITERSQDQTLLQNWSKNKDQETLKNQKQVKVQKIQDYSQQVCVTETSLTIQRLSTENNHQTLQKFEDQENLMIQIEDTKEEECDKSQTLEFCEQIEEVTDESLQNSIIQQSLEKVGPSSFEPISLIGQGSFGEVYLVKKLDGTNKFFAMKILQKSKIMGQNLVKYAVTERNVLSITKHPFIVGLNYAFQTTDKLFLILDYCPGGDLGKALCREKRFNEDRARIYLAEVLLALEDLHKRDIIFRDLKPDNVVLDEDGHALLTDFGLSKQGVYDNTGAQSFCGSVAYLAPEMLKRIGHGKSVDWYLLGVLLYEMLVGIPPYFTTNKEKLFQNIQRGPLLIPAQLSTQAKSLIIGLLSKNPTKRLGAQRDAEEIKEHPFFEGIDWEEVLQKKLQPPKPEIQQFRQLQPSEMLFYAEILKKELEKKQQRKLLNEQNAVQIIEPNKKEDQNNLYGWSFASPTQINITKSIPQPTSNS